MTLAAGLPLIVTAATALEAIAMSPQADPTRKLHFAARAADTRTHAPLRAEPFEFDIDDHPVKMPPLFVSGPAHCRGEVDSPPGRFSMSASADMVSASADNPALDCGRGDRLCIMTCRCVISVTDSKECPVAKRRTL